MLCLETEVSLCRLHPSFAAGVSRFQTLGTSAVHLQEQPCVVVVVGVGVVVVVGVGVGVVGVVGVGVGVVVVVGESQIQTSNW